MALAVLGVAKFGSNAERVAANVDAMHRALELADSVTPTALAQSAVAQGKFETIHPFNDGRPLVLPFDLCYDR